MMLHKALAKRKESNAANRRDENQHEEDVDGGGADADADADDDDDDSDDDDENEYDDGGDDSDVEADVEVVVAPPEINNNNNQNNNNNNQKNKKIPNVDQDAHELLFVLLGQVIQLLCVRRLTRESLNVADTTLLAYNMLFAKCFPRCCVFNQHFNGSHLKGTS
jgi:hypothetical protein